MSLARRIETTANASTILVAVLITSVLFKTYFLPNTAHRTLATSTPLSRIVRGSSMDSQTLALDWKRNRHTLVLAISTICHYCQDSVPFYRTLGAKATNVKLVAVLPQPVSEGQKYLAENGVRIDEIRQIRLNDLGVLATPTLLLVDDAGLVTQVWVGRLQPEQETEVLAALEKPSQ